MASVGIIRVYDEIIQSNGDYCKVCFRTARERKLVTPVFFRRFLVAVNNCGSYNSEIKVCFICERLARSAMKFHRAVIFGFELEDLFDIMKSEDIRDEVLMHIDGAESANEVCHRAKACEEQYEMMQGTIPYSLECTNTLLVSVRGAPRPSLNAGKVYSARPSDGARGRGFIFGCEARDPLHREAVGGGPHRPRLTPPLVSVEDDPKTVHNPKGTVMTSDDVVILDDDEPPPLMRLSTRPLAPLMGTDLQVKVAERGGEQVLLHPMITGSDGNIYVPSLKLQILSNNDFRAVSDEELQLFVKQPNIHTLADKKTQELTVGYNYQDFLMQQNVNKMQEIIQANHMNIVLNFEDSESNSKKAKYDDPFYLGDGSQNSKASDGGVHVENGVKMYNREKRPVLSNARVDWEDKIPMDVISYMDATDPNPDERIMQPSSPALGVISNVHSIEEDVQIIENVECIDLC